MSEQEKAQAALDALVELQDDVSGRCDSFI